MTLFKYVASSGQLHLLELSFTTLDTAGTSVENMTMQLKVEFGMNEYIYMFRIIREMHHKSVLWNCYPRVAIT